MKEAKEFAESIAAIFIETSARNAVNVEELFRKISRYHFFTVCGAMSCDDFVFIITTGVKKERKVVSLCAIKPHMGLIFSTVWHKEKHTFSPILRKYPYLLLRHLASSMCFNFFNLYVVGLNIFFSYRLYI